MSEIFKQDNLIPVIEGEIGGELQPCVDARELHNWLKCGEMFSTWMKKRIKTYKFVENEDFAMVLEITKTIRIYENSMRKGGSKKYKYLLSLDMAKELSMVENNEQGRQARRYFINCEKTLRKTAFSLFDQFNKASLEFERFTELASNAGRTLSLVGKQYKPQAKKRLDELEEKAQPHLVGLELYS